VTGRGGRRRKKLPDDLKGERIHCCLKGKHYIAFLKEAMDLSQPRLQNERTDDLCNQDRMPNIACQLG